MKKERFKEIVSSYSPTSEELKSLQKLAIDYPFSQIVHLLLANAYKNEDKEDKKNFKTSLSKAALHATDRSILKSLIEHNLVPSELEESAIKQLSKTQSGRNVKESVRIEDAEALRAEVLENLQVLIQTKKEASAWFDDAPSKPKQQKPSTQKTTKPKTAKAKASPKTNTRVKKQSPIIDKFIKEEPKIRKNAKTTNDKEDLAKDSSKMRDDVVSESLAKIFASQGKTEKAIEIYKKLIWKLPQKKALFAAQIEKLKKK